MPLRILERNVSTPAVVEATPTVQRPPRARANRAGFVPDIPRGGSTDNNPISAGSVSRSDLLDQLYLVYVNCPWVSACVDVIARTCTAGGIQCVPNSYSQDNAKIPTPPPEVKAVQELLQQINPQDDVRQLFRTLIMDLLIFGDAFCEVTYVGSKPMWLWHLSPPTMTVNANEHGIVTGYTQVMDTGRKVPFAPNEVIHIRLDSPKGGLYGVSPTEKNLMAIQAWLFTMALVTETMRRGDPIRAWVDWPPALADSDIQRFQQQYAIRNLGAKNIGNLFETKGGATVHELGVNKVSDWLIVLQHRRDEIISGFGVPPSKVSVIESGNLGGGTGTSQDRMFKINTCGPLQELILEKFTYALLFKAYGVTDWHLKFADVDWRDDQVVEQIRDLRIRNGMYSLNRARADIGEPPTDGGDDPILVDRQNLVLWSDMSALSHANLQVLQGKGPDASGALQQAPGPPGAPKSPTSTPGTTSTRGTSKGPNAKRTAAKGGAAASRRTANASDDDQDTLFEQFRAYQERRAQVLKESP